MGEFVTSDASSSESVSSSTSTPSSNSGHAFAAFQQLVAEDAAIFTRLENTSDSDDFIARAVELGAAHGLIFGSGDVKAALQNARRAWFERVKL
jgi:hypothetical protein